jgi:hypothetical protein
MGIVKHINLKVMRKRAIEEAQDRIDVTTLSGNDKDLTARFLELAGLEDGTIDPLEYIRPPPPSPMRRSPRS